MKGQNNDWITSGFGRALRLGGLAGRMSASFLGTKIRLPFVGEVAAADLMRDVWIKEARRMVDRLGTMKGAAMKFGQMMSIAEGALPPEAVEILSELQKDAKPLPFAAIKAQLESELGERYHEFEWIEEVAFASASIGQVHRGRLRDGRDVALKIQFPDMDRIVRADVRNLKLIVSPLFTLLGGVNLEPVWIELEERLAEELDYEREARNLQRYAELTADRDDLILPRVYPEFSTRRVLVMEFVGGLSGEEALAPGIPQELRNRWGQTMMSLALEGFLVHRFLHTDPHPGNYAFREDGRLVMYDFGSVKEVPEPLARAYGLAARALLDEELERIPPVLMEVGIHMKDGAPIRDEFIEDHAGVLAQPFRPSPPFAFGANPELLEKLVELGGRYWYESMSIEFPADILMVHRAMGGQFGNLSRLKAEGPWRDLLVSMLERADVVPGRR